MSQFTNVGFRHHVLTQGQGDLYEMTAPEEYEGRFVARVEARPCARRINDYLICGWVQGHLGECLPCSEEFIAGLWGMSLALLSDGKVCPP